MSAKKSDIDFEVIKNSYIGTLKKYVVFKGRARRREFWIFFFVNLVLGLIPFIGQLVSLLTCIPGIAVGVRRLHDTNRSGFWILLAYILFFVDMIFFFVGFILGAGFLFGIRSGRMGSLMIPAIIILIVLLVLAIMLLVWAVQEGTRGSNKYGPDPKRGAVRRTASASRKR
jgi:uncharacterized membrane protein YhaH (DUF805 family)